jgi:putative DNA primase/helicase
VHDPRWADVLTYDAFAESVIMQSIPPWHHTDGKGAAAGDWTEEDTSRLESWFQRAYGIRVSETKIMGAVSVAARARVVHPVRTYLRSLEWDGAARLDAWLVQLFGAEDSEYTRAIGRAFLISAVARIMRPGCKVDTMLVLEGKTGINKSTAIRALATGSGTDDSPQSWYTEISAEIDPRETPQLLRRKWIAELGELASLRRTRDQETIKSFLSRQDDNYRPPYGKRARDFPRQSVFVGTTNDDHYLRDVTGARRYWPVKCQKIFLQGIEIERNQLWAEAVKAFDDGEPWHLTKASVLAASVEAQSERFEDDVWLEVVRDWCEARKVVGVTIEDVMGGALGLEIGAWNHSDAMRVGAVLRRLGWAPVGRARPRLYKPAVEGAS